MIHYMKLNPEPFQMISCGAKTIELRLNDEKRQQIRGGDIIIFTNTAQTDKALRTQVTALHRFADFAALYDSLPLERCGYLPEEVDRASFHDMEKYYDQEAQRRYGVVGIEIECI